MSNNDGRAHSARSMLHGGGSGPKKPKGFMYFYSLVSGKNTSRAVNNANVAMTLVLYGQREKRNNTVRF